MWDSSTSDEVGRARAAAAPTPPADRFEPGHGAKQAVMDLALGRNSLTLEPDRPLLTGENTTYPVYIDPTFSAPGAREAWALAYSRPPAPRTTTAPGGTTRTGRSAPTKRAWATRT